MIWVHRGQKIPLNVYHGVPLGWRAGEIRREHSRLNGTFDLGGPDATEPGAPSFLIHRFDWLQYRETLYRVGKGVRAGDPACAEIAVRFIELQYIGPYSGYVRSGLARSLKSAALTPAQKRRLHDHFAGLVLRREKLRGFEDYARLWRRIITREQKEALYAELQRQADGAAQIKWLSPKL